MRGILVSEHNVATKIKLVRHISTKLPTPTSITMVTKDLLLPLSTAKQSTPPTLRDVGFALGSSLAALDETLLGRLSPSLSSFLPSTPGEMSVGALSLLAGLLSSSPPLSLLLDVAKRLSPLLTSLFTTPTGISVLSSSPHLLHGLLPLMATPALPLPPSLNLPILAIRLAAWIPPSDPVLETALLSLLALSWSSSSSSSSSSHSSSSSSSAGFASFSAGSTRRKETETETEHDWVSHRVVGSMGVAFGLLGDQDLDPPPSPCLGRTVDVVPIDLLPAIMGSLAGSFLQDESKVVTAIIRLLTWEGMTETRLQWASAFVHSLWAMGCGRGLARVAEECVVILAGPAGLGVDLARASRLLCTLLLGYTSSSVLFLRALPSMARVVARTSPHGTVEGDDVDVDREEEDGTGEALLVRTMALLMYKFPGHPSIYGKVLPLLPRSVLELSPEVMDAELKDAAFPLSTESGAFKGEGAKERQRAMVQAQMDAALDAQGPIKGLANLGNTCYLNAFLQALAVLPGLPGLLMEMHATRPLSRPTQKLFEALAWMAFCDRPVFSPSDLHKALPLPFSGYAQQDSGELARVLLGTLEFDAAAASESASESFRSLLMGQITTQTTCTLCGYVSVRTEDENVVNLPVAGTTLSECIDAAFADESMEGENAYACPTCQGLVPATRSVIEYAPPRHAIFALNRFTYDPVTQSRSKVGGAVMFPEALELGGEGYSLVGVVVHSGRSAHHGHYYAYVSGGGGGGEWYQANDAFVTRSEYAEFALASSSAMAGAVGGGGETPYLLVYSRDSPPPPPSGGFGGVGLDDLPLALASGIRADNARFASEVRTAASSSTTHYDWSVFGSRRDGDGDDGGFGGGEDRMGQEPFQGSDWSSLNNVQ